MGFYEVNRFLTSDNGKPFDQNANQTWNTIGLPMWFTRSTLHRAICIIEGPYTDPLGQYVVPANNLLVKFEVRQPPENTTQARNYPRPETYAILPINRDFILADSLMSFTVDPAGLFAPGDLVAVWMTVATPAEVIGKFLGPDSPYRSNAGSMV